MHVCGFRSGWRSVRAGARRGGGCGAR
jgi:hypothetical protein